MTGKPTTTPCECGGTFVEFHDGVTDPGSEGSSTDEVVTICPNCGITIEEAAAKSQRKAELVFRIMALRPTGTEQH